MDIPTTIKNQKLVEKRRRQIVLAAIKLFSKKGFHGTTLRDLAEESGLSYGNIYDYVGSKEDIFALIHDHVASLVMQTLKADTANIADPIEKLRRIVRAEFKLMDQWADAILLIYQESHILSPPYLHKLLSKEREHLKLIEETIEESFLERRLRPCSPRLTANLIKAMVDAWVIKRWDLRGFANRLEAEKAIIDLLTHGLLLDGLEGAAVGPEPEGRSRRLNLQGKAALVANTGTPIGAALCTALAAEQARVAAYAQAMDPSRETPLVCDESSAGLKFYSAEEHGPLTAELFSRIYEEMGTIDVLIHELGAGNLDAESDRDGQVGRRLSDNLRSAEEIAGLLVGEMPRNLPERLIYICPWGWDGLADPVRSETVRGAALALTRRLAERLAGHGTTVNCLAPGFLRTARPSRLEKRHQDGLKDLIPSGRLGEINDLTEMVLFLAGDAAKYVTGQLIEVSGGGVGFKGSK